MAPWLVRAGTYGQLEEYFLKLLQASRRPSTWLREFVAER